MAKAVINLQKESGGIVKISPVDGTGVTEVTVPESGNLVSVGTVVTDNAIVRFDGTTGQVQNSGVMIDDNGNVGMGITPNAWFGGLNVLQVHQSNISATAGNDLRLGSNYVRDNTNYKYLNNGYATNYTQYDGGHQWSTAPSGTAGNPITWTNTMTLASNGNLLVGISTDNGVDKLQVNGGISKKIENSNGVEFKLGNSIWSISIPQGTVQTANQIFSTMSIPVHTGGMYILYAMYNNTMSTSSKVYHFHSSYDGTSKGSSITLISQGGYTGDSWYGNCKLTLTTTPSSTTLNFVAEANITSQNSITYHLVKIGI